MNKIYDEVEIQRIVEKWSAVLNQPMTGCSTVMLLESQEKWFTKEEVELSKKHE